MTPWTRDATDQDYRLTAVDMVVAVLDATHAHRCECGTLVEPATDLEIDTVPSRVDTGLCRTCYAQGAR